jgi:Flp pilus assembly protein TadB
MSPLALALGAGLGVGLVLVAVGLSGLVGVRLGRSALPPRLALAASLAVVAFMATGWPVAAAAGAGAGWWLPAWSAGRRAGRERATRAETLASWVEALRDLVSAGVGLPDALAATAATAPAPIRGPLTELARQARTGPIAEALATFAAEVADPTADYAAAALSLVTRRSGSLVPVLEGLAAHARDELAARQRARTARAGVEAAGAIVATTTTILVVLFAVLDPGFLDAYRGLVGQGVLALVVGCFAGSFAWLGRLGAEDATPRLLLVPEGRR